MAAALSRRRLRGGASRPRQARETAAAELRRAHVHSPLVFFSSCGSTGPIESREGTEATVLPPVAAAASVSCRLITLHVVEINGQENKKTGEGLGAHVKGTEGRRELSVFFLRAGCHGSR